jgi:hypothetical protein
MGAEWGYLPASRGSTWFRSRYVQSSAEQVKEVEPSLNRRQVVLRSNPFPPAPAVQFEFSESAVRRWIYGESAANEHPF